MPNPREEVERGDLVERLRSWVRLHDATGNEKSRTARICAETADEIERLRAALSRAEAEREERTTALEALVRAVDGLLLSFTPKVAEAMAEAKRVLALGLSRAGDGGEQ